VCFKTNRDVAKVKLFLDKGAFGFVYNALAFYFDTVAIFYLEHKHFLLAPLACWLESHNDIFR